MVKDGRKMPEDSFTLKEMMQELRRDSKTMLEHAARTEEHLKTLNSKVATHERELGHLKTFKWKLAGMAILLSIALPIVLALIKR